MTTLRPLRPLDVLFVLMIAIQVAGLWMWKFFPSGDGPSHLYNVSVLFNYDKVPIYREYFRIEFSPAGNLMTDLLLGGLMKIFPPLIAEKVLLSIYLISFPVVFRILLTALAPEAAPSFSFFAFLLTYNLFLHLGSWNFCFSLPLALLALWMVARSARSTSIAAFGGVALLALATYCAHLVSWGMLVLATGSILLCEQIGWPATPSQRSLSGRLGVFAAVSVPGVLAALFVAGDPHRLGFAGGSLGAKAKILYKLPFLESVGDAEAILRRGLLVVFIGAITALTARRWLYRKPFWNPLLAVGAASCLLAVFGPRNYGNGLNIRERVELFAVLFLLAGLAIAGWPRIVNRVLPFVLSGLSLIAMWHRRPAYEHWNRRLAEYAALDPYIGANSTVLRLFFGDFGLQPTFHAMGYWAPKPFIDVANYEANANHFTVRFKNGKSLQERGLMWSGGKASLAGYLRKLVSAGAPFDYVLVDATPRKLEEWDDAVNASGFLSAYDLNYATPWPGSLRLYRNLKMREAMSFER